MEKMPHREEFENLLAKQSEEKEELKNAAQEEALGDDEKITELSKEIKEITGAKEKAETGVSIETAKEILGEEKVLTPETASELLGVAAEEIPNIPFSKEEFEDAAKNNERLHFRLPNVNMEKLVETMKEKADDDEMKKTGGLRYVNDNIKSKYFSRGKTKAGWAFVSSEPLKETYSKTAPVQLKVLIDTLEQRYGGELPDKYKDAAEKFRNEFAGKIAEVTKLSEAQVKTESDKEIDQAVYDDAASAKAREKLVSWLENSEIAKLLTATITEGFYDFALRYLSAKTDSEKEQLRKDFQNYTRIFQSTSADGLAGLGGLESGGVDADAWHPDGRYSDDGLSFSRS